MTAPLMAALLMFMSTASEPPPAMCSVLGELAAPTEGSIRELVQQAEVIVYARAIEQRRPPGIQGFPGAEVHFEVLEVLHGSLDNPELWIYGGLTAEDDFNTGSVPYLQVRSDGMSGSCFAYTYRIGGEFLLLLRRDENGSLTPYWRLFAPTNEQVRGPEDPWLVWVRNELVEWTHPESAGPTVDVTLDGISYPPAESSARTPQGTARPSCFGALLPDNIAVVDAAADRDWYTKSEIIHLFGEIYAKFGMPRGAETFSRAGAPEKELAFVASFDGVPFFGDRVELPEPEIVYAPLDAECTQVQAYAIGYMLQ